MALSFLLLETLSTLADLFYPPHCAGCKKYLLNERYLCCNCWSKAGRLSEHHCTICSHQFSAAIDVHDSKNCPNCAGRKLFFDGAVSAFSYRGLVQKLIFKFKYGGEQSLKKLLSEMIAIALKDERLAQISFTAVVPVPLYFLREREREFNQARLLANEVARHLKLPMYDCLMRVKPTPMQARAGKRERIENLQDAFMLKAGKQFIGNYLLVDDVLTTGSTANECAKVLREAGAKSVWVVTVARS